MPVRPPPFVEDKLAGESPMMANLSTLTSALPAAAIVDPSSKSLMDLLGEVLVPNKGSGLPARLRLTSYNPSEGTAMLHGVGTGQPVESSIDDLMKLHRSGVLSREGPPTEGLSIPALISRLLKAIPDGK